jgi:hypothetical protein
MINAVDMVGTLTFFMSPLASYPMIYYFYLVIITAEI